MAKDPLIGRQIDHYRVERHLGAGGMGAVYLAKDLNLQRDVALKIMHEHFATQKQFQRRFQQEAQAAANLRHDNIIQIYAFDAKDGQLFIAMEYIAEGSLRDYLEQEAQGANQIDLEVAIQLVRQLAEALHYAHEQGMVHRDVKPDNVLLKSVSPGQQRAVLTDFGLAQLLQSSGSDSDLEGTLGTLEYMSPEQCIIGRTIDKRSDIYALGIVLYELVAGRRPFQPRTPQEAIEMHTRQAAPPVKQFRPNVTVELDDVIKKSMQKDPPNRYQTARDMSVALDRALQSLTAPEPATELEPPPVPVEGPYTGPIKVHVTRDGMPYRNLPYDKDTITLGRGDNQDIWLEDPTKRVSRRHLQIVRSRENGYQIIDLGSGNGTDLHNQPVSPHVPTTWPEGQIIEIGAYQLRWEPDEALADDLYKTGMEWDQPGGADLYQTGLDAFPTPPEAPPAPPPITRQHPDPQPAPPPQPRYEDTSVEPQMVPQYQQQQPGMVASPADEAIGVTIAQPTLTAIPGQPQMLAIQIENRSDRVDHFKIEVLDLPPEWYSVSKNDVNLMTTKSSSGNTSDQVMIQVLTPRDSSSTAGQHPYRVRVTATAQQLQKEMTGLILMIEPYYDFAIDLQPKDLKGRRKAVMSVMNNGNSEVRYNLSGIDQAHDLDFDLGQAPQVELQPGEDILVPVKITPKTRPLIGAAGKQIQFEMSVATGDQTGGKQTQQGRLTVYPLIPRWLPAAIILAAMLCGFLALRFIEGQNAAATATAEALALVASQAATIESGATAQDVEVNLTVTAEADPDADGLPTWEENQRFNTLWNNPDTDGDGLLDGEEVRQWGTDPLKNDTDEDGLFDGDEVNECTLPTNPDTDGDGERDNVDDDPCGLLVIPDTPTPIPTLRPELASCPDSPPARLEVGKRGRVQEGGVDNRLRPEPNTDAEQVGLLPRGTEFVVTDGPACNQAEGGRLLRFWKVRASGHPEAWTAEGDCNVGETVEDAYFLEPVEPKDPEACT